ncbi:unnamed protein product [Colias eurytheme]|nr:unnamed protein product [Colias eurytheme]
MIQDESSKENIHGITCSGSDKRIYGSSNNNMNSNVSDPILFDIRDVLVKLSMDKSNQDRNFNSINDRLKDLVVGSNITNTLLERFLQSDVNDKMVIPKTTSLFNVSKVNNNPYNTTVNDSNLATSDEGGNKMTAINEKIAIMNKTMNKSLEHITSELEKHSNSVLFTDICMGLLLTVVLCFTAYKIYESVVLTPKRRSYSTQEIVVPMDNSHV